MATATGPLPKAARKARERIDVLTVTDFIIQNAITNARQAIREYETWTLERPDAEIFAAALMEPAAPGPELTQAVRRYKKRFLPR